MASAARSGRRQGATVRPAGGTAAAGSLVVGSPAAARNLAGTADNPAVGSPVDPVGDNPVADTLVRLRPSPQWGIRQEKDTVPCAPSCLDRIRPSNDRMAGRTARQNRRTV